MDAEHSADEGGQSSASEGEPPEPGPEDRVTIRMATAAASIDANWVVARLESVLDVLGNEGATPIGRVAIRVVDDAEMDRLHQKHSGIAGTTDVLTFVEAEPTGLGVDLVACLDEARRRADDLGADADAASKVVPPLDTGALAPPALQNAGHCPEYIWTFVKNKTPLSSPATSAMPSLHSTPMTSPMTSPSVTATPGDTTMPPLARV